MFIGPPLAGIAAEMPLLQRVGSALRVERSACSGCRSDIFVTNRAGRLVYAVLMFIGPPLAGIAAEMPLLRFYRGRNAAPTAGRLSVEGWACSVCRSDIFVTNRAARPAYTALMFIGPPLAGIAAEMPLLRFYRGRNAARTALFSIKSRPYGVMLAANFCSRCPSARASANN